MAQSEDRLKPGDPRETEELTLGLEDAQTAAFEDAFRALGSLEVVLRDQSTVLGSLEGRLRDLEARFAQLQTRLVERLEAAEAAAGMRLCRCGHLEAWHLSATGAIQGWCGAASCACGTFRPLPKVR